jgi:hypothetical protein
MSAGALPDPPESLAGPPRAFYDEMRRMLADVKPGRVDPSTSAARFDRKGVEVELVHADRHDWTIWATVGDRDGIVSTSYAHEHFFAPAEGEAEERSWTTQMVDFIAEILRGEIEVETDFRGNSLLAVRHFNLNERGERSPLGYTGFLVPARLLFWRPKRTETERLSFR